MFVNVMECESLSQSQLNHKRTSKLTEILFDMKIFLYTIQSTTYRTNSISTFIDHNNINNNNFNNITTLKLLGRDLILIILVFSLKWFCFKTNASKVENWMCEVMLAPPGPTPHNPDP